MVFKLFCFLLAGGHFFLLYSSTVKVHKYIPLIKSRVPPTPGFFCTPHYFPLNIPALRLKEILSSPSQVSATFGEMDWAIGVTHEILSKGDWEVSMESENQTPG